MGVCGVALRRARRAVAGIGLSILCIAGQLPDRAEAQQADVLSIGGTVTEIVYALGLGARLLGRDTTSTWPSQATALPDVGYMRALSPEGILSVAPQLIIATEEAGPPETIDAIKAASIQYVVVPEVFSGKGIANKIQVVGAALGVADRARVLADKVLADMDAVATARHTPPKRVMFVLSLQGGRVMASGAGTAADAAITLAGGVNALTGFEGYKPMADEAIAAARPEVVLMMNRGGNHDASAVDLFLLPAFASTPAAASQALIKVDGLALLGFGPRTAQALHDLNTALYGE